jgi:hypothetical protein
MIAMPEAATTSRQTRSPLWLKILASLAFFPIVWYGIIALGILALPDDATRFHLTAEFLLLTAAVFASLIVVMTVRHASSRFLYVLVVSSLSLGLLGSWIGWESRQYQRSAIRESAPMNSAPMNRPMIIPQSPQAQQPATQQAPNTSPNAADRVQDLPEFPWPPPVASAHYVLPQSLFSDRATVGDVATAIISALEHNRYVERSFFRTAADGVALVTRLERINDDGTSLAGNQRWPSGGSGNRDAAPKSAGDLFNILYGLFYADPGRYRIIVFILQDRPFSQSSRRITDEEAREWLWRGANSLPRPIAERSFTDGTCTALVYEFASNGTMANRVDSRLTGRQHLEKAGVLAILAKAN